MRALAAATALVALLCCASFSLAAATPDEASPAGYHRLSRRHAATSRLHGRIAQPSGDHGHQTLARGGAGPPPCSLNTAEGRNFTDGSQAAPGGDGHAAAAADGDDGKGGGPLFSRPLFTPPDDLFFVVAAPDHSDFCGGCMVLHRLCDRLNVMYDGVRETPLCYLESVLDPHHTRPLGLNPGYKTPMLPPWLNASDGVVVYPESVAGNPFKADRVIHWILYFPGVHGGVASAAHYDARNLIACYSPGFCADFDDATFTKVALRVVDYEFAHFLNVHPPPGGRAGWLTFRRKENFSTPRLGRINIANATFPVPENPLQDGGKRSRIEQYARVDRFYTTDPATFRSMEAAMAGAVSVVVPVPGVTKAEWLASVSDEFRFGIAYGEDDIPHAQATLPCVMPYMRYKAALEREGVDAFVRQAVAYFAGRNGTSA